MPAPIAVAKAALVVNKEVRNRIPGGWVTVVASVLAIVVLLPTLAVVGVMNAVAPIFRGGPAEVCATDVVSGEHEGDDDHAPGTGGGSSFNQPFPSSDSSRIVAPVASGVIMSSGYGMRQVPAGTIDFSGGAGVYLHNGIDYAGPLGTPIFSIADGIVASAQAGTAGAYGSLIVINHTVNGEKYTSSYGHVQSGSVKVKAGDTVKAGQKIAGMGSEGNSTGSHLHMVVTKGPFNGTSNDLSGRPGSTNAIDPAKFLRENGAEEVSGGLTGDDFSSGGVSSDADTVCREGDEGKSLEGNGLQAWGTFENGQIPSNMIKSISFDSDHKLYEQAATGIEEMNKAFKARFGKNLPIKWAYLDLDAQESLYDKGTTLMKPGKHLLGWGRGVEFNVSFASQEYKWLMANGSKYGWSQPSIYSQSGASPIPGLFGYTGTDPLPGAVSGDAQTARDYARQELIRRGFTSGSEYACVVKLWEKESNWRYDAINPAFSPSQPNDPQYQAYGIVQAAPGSKMASEGSDWRTNYKTQVRWGLGYIEERYKSPCAAWQHSQENNWY